jgi:hypothetical protein
VLYILIGAIALIGVNFFLEKRRKERFGKTGIKVTGTIVHNKESFGNDKFRLGGNINNPTITFVTIEGEEITGEPVTGFISQHEVVVPSQVNVIYNKFNPRKFYVI